MMTVSAAKPRFLFTQPKQSLKKRVKQTGFIACRFACAAVRET